MQPIKLPLTVDEIRAAKGLSYRVFYVREQVTRIAESVVSVDTDISASFHFSIDNRYVVITGDACVTVTLMCQRCRGTFEHQLHVSYCVSPVANDEQAKALPQAYEPIEFDLSGKIDFLAIIEDEIILALPVVPLHESEYCKAFEANIVFGQLPEEVEKHNPFAVLAGFKKNT